MTKSDKRKRLIADAIKIAGSQKILAGKIGASQQLVSKLLNDSDAEVSATYAMRIEMATAGKIRKADLRPDLFGKAA